MPQHFQHQDWRDRVPLLTTEPIVVKQALNHPRTTYQHAALLRDSMSRCKIDLKPMELIHHEYLCKGKAKFLVSSEPGR